LSLCGISCLPLVVRFGGSRGNQLHRFKRLELHRIGTDFHGRIYQLLGKFQTAIVIHARLGNDEARMAIPDLFTADFHGPHEQADVRFGLDRSKRTPASISWRIIEADGCSFQARW
jgi:hypothetical protein